MKSMCEYVQWIYHRPSGMLVFIYFHYFTIHFVCCRGIGRKYRFDSHFILYHTGFVSIFYCFSLISNIFESTTTFFAWLWSQQSLIARWDITILKMLQYRLIKLIILFTTNVPFDDRWKKQFCFSIVWSMIMKFKKRKWIKLMVKNKRPFLSVDKANEVRLNN